jgi:hypothetical protein
MKALLSASSGADVVSVSYAIPEDCLDSAQLAEAGSVVSALAARHITVTAITGDWGAALQACTPVCPTCEEQTIAKTASICLPRTRWYWPWAAPRSPPTPTRAPTLLKWRGTTPLVILPQAGALARHFPGLPIRKVLPV